jgi:hypothetical protein
MYTQRTYKRIQQTYMDIQRTYMHKQRTYMRYVHIQRTYTYSERMHIKQVYIREGETAALLYTYPLSYVHAVGELSSPSDMLSYIHADVHAICTYSPVYIPSHACIQSLCESWPFLLVSSTRARTGGSGGLIVCMYECMYTYNIIARIYV